MENKFVNFSCVNVCVREENVKKWKKEEEIASGKVTFLPIAVAAHAKFLKNFKIFKPNLWNNLFHELIIYDMIFCEKINYQIIFGKYLFRKIIGEKSYELVY